MCVPLFVKKKCLILKAVEAITSVGKEIMFLHSKPGSPTAKHQCTGIFTSFNVSSDLLLRTWNFGHWSQNITSKPEAQQVIGVQIPSCFPAERSRIQTSSIATQEWTEVHQQNQTGSTKWAFLVFIWWLLRKI